MFDSHPLADTINSFMEHLSRETGEGDAAFFPREEYHQVLKRGATYYGALQNRDGAIIDPDFDLEWHYSTPCFAYVASYLYSLGFEEWHSRALRALEWSVDCLAEDRVPQGHSNFYTSLIMRAEQHIGDGGSRCRRAKIASLDPNRIYDFSDTKVPPEEIHNWNLLALSGEARRIKMGLGAPGSEEFTQRHLPYHLDRFTPEGLYRDGVNSPWNFANPIAYDLLARGAMADLFDQEFFEGSREKILELLQYGALTQLFFQDPNGEYTSVGRSSHHTWNEACLALNAEWAAGMMKEIHLPLARSFRRQAQLALRSLSDCYEEEGRLYILRNRFPIHERQGYEQYSVSTTYNLWILASLAMAAEKAEESIPAGEIPSERFSYGVYGGDSFHLLAAAGGGSFICADLCGDPVSNPTGIVRVAAAGFPSLLGPSAGSVASPRFHTMVPGRFLCHGPGWLDRYGSHRSLAEIVTTRLPNFFRVPYLPFRNIDPAKETCNVELLWRGGFSGASLVSISITLSKNMIRFSYRVEGSIKEMWAEVPLLFFDGKEQAKYEMRDGSCSISFRGKSLIINHEPQDRFALDEPIIGSRIGLLKRGLIYDGDRDGEVSFSLQFI